MTRYTRVRQTRTRKGVRRGHYRRMHPKSKVAIYNEYLTGVAAQEGRTYDLASPRTFVVMPQPTKPPMPWYGVRITRKQRRRNGWDGGRPAWIFNGPYKNPIDNLLSAPIPAKVHRDPDFLTDEARVRINALKNGRIIRRMRVHGDSLDPAIIEALESGASVRDVSPMILPPDDRETPMTRRRPRR